MGCGQAVRHLALNEKTVGSNPTIPAPSFANDGASPLFVRRVELVLPFANLESFTSPHQ